MKNFKTIIAVLAISLASVFSVTATENEPNNKNKILRAKIANLLGSEVSFILEDKKPLDVEVSFVLNSKNEVVIMSVDSSNEEIDSYIKNKLNYKTVVVKGIKKGEIYRVPLKIKQV